VAVSALSAAAIIGEMGSSDWGIGLSSTVSSFGLAHAQEPAAGADVAQQPTHQKRDAAYQQAAKDRPGWGRPPPRLRPGRIGSATVSA
jgi:hypothetical protein